MSLRSRLALAVATALSLSVLLAAGVARADTGPYLDFAAWPSFAPGQSTVGATVLGAEGVPQVDYAWGAEDNPVTVCHWALQRWSWWLQTHDRTYLDQALLGADWLVDHQVDGRFEYRFDITAGGTPMTAPWISAMAQGEGISLLVRAYSATGDPRYLQTAEAALAPFHRDFAQGGVLAYWDGEPWYEEYPGAAPTHVLNGFEFALIGLHDLADRSADARQLFAQGIVSLSHRIAAFDTPAARSQYYAALGSAHSVVAAPYPHVDAVLTQQLATITGDPTLAAWAARWTQYLQPVSSTAGG